MLQQFLDKDIYCKYSYSDVTRNLKEYDHDEQINMYKLAPRLQGGGV